MKKMRRKNFCVKVALFLFLLSVGKFLRFFKKYFECFCCFLKEEERKMLLFSSSSSSSFQKREKKKRRSITIVASLFLFGVVFLCSRVVFEPVFLLKSVTPQEEKGCWGFLEDMKKILSC